MHTVLIMYLLVELIVLLLLSTHFVFLIVGSAIGDEPEKLKSIYAKNIILARIPGTDTAYIFSRKKPGETEQWQCVFCMQARRDGVAGKIPLVKVPKLNLNYSFIRKVS